jgi:asparagine synthase (glutamine-hydrolysing)
VTVSDFVSVRVALGAHGPAPEIQAPMAVAERCEDAGGVAVGFARTDPDKSGLKHLLDCARHSDRALAHAANEFVLIDWRSADATLRAYRDPFGIRPLYYAASNDGIAVSTAASELGRGRPFNEEFFASFIASRCSCPGLTPWQGVHELMPGSVLTWTADGMSVRKYWDLPASGHRASGSVSLSDAGAEFMRLLKASLRRCLDADGSTWAHLSGGLDSSTVVSAAAHGAEGPEGLPHLGGTISFVDDLGNADETSFSNTVVERWRVANHRVEGFWPWRSDEEPPPSADMPSMHYPYYARDRYVDRLVSERGGRAILSGVGPDELLPLSPSVAADLIWSGQIQAGLSIILEWSIGTRSSFWRSLREHAIEPLGPRGYRMKRAQAERPSWIDAEFANRTSFDDKGVAFRTTDHRRGEAYDSTIRHYLGRMSAMLPHWKRSDHLVVRHPFLDVELVEFVLSLPLRFRTDFTNSKALLREAGKGILPESIRTRKSKGTLEPRYRWAFQNEAAVLQTMARRSVLADLGCVDRKALGAAIGAYSTGLHVDASQLLATLSLEAWLAAISGRYGESHHSSTH